MQEDDRSRNLVVQEQEEDIEIVEEEQFDINTGEGDNSFTNSIIITD